jgi:hypothetical protein
VRRVGLVVSTSDSRFGVAGSSPHEGTTHQCVTSLSNMFTRTGSGKPSLPSLQVDKFVPASAGVEVLSAAIGATAGWPGSL